MIPNNPWSPGDPSGQHPVVQAENRSMDAFGRAWPPLPAAPASDPAEAPDAPHLREEEHLMVSKGRVGPPTPRQPYEDGDVSPMGRFSGIVLDTRSAASTIRELKIRLRRANEELSMNHSIKPQPISDQDIPDLEEGATKGMAISTAMVWLFKELEELESEVRELEDFVK